MTPLSPRQADALAFIRTHVTTRGCSPTLREIGAALGIASKARVEELVQALVDKKQIERGRGDARGIRVLGVCPHCGGDK